MSRFLHADWPAHSAVRTLVTTRAGGVSKGRWSSFNLGFSSGDDRAAVEENRRRLTAVLPSPPAWLRQVHGNEVVRWAQAREGIEGDAVLTRKTGRVCAVLTADCLPVLLADLGGREVAAVHAGWRGLAAGVIARTIETMTADAAGIIAWLGPAISGEHYQVGDEVREVFIKTNPASEAAFRADGTRWRADLYELARQQLSAAGVGSVFGGEYCTFAEPERFYSYRRDGRTGRMASLIWLEDT